MPVVRLTAWSALAGAIVVAGAAMAQQARSQFNASPSWVPIGTSASGTSSTVWFHEPASRQAVACRTVEGTGGAPASVQCVTGKLP